MKRARPTVGSTDLKFAAMTWMIVLKMKRSEIYV